jgi:hypothetical protein
LCNFKNQISNIKPLDFTSSNYIVKDLAKGMMGRAITATRDPAISHHVPSPILTTTSLVLFLATASSLDHLSPPLPPIIYGSNGTSSHRQVLATASNSSKLISERIFISVTKPAS